MLVPGLTLALLLFAGGVYAHVGGRLARKRVGGRLLQGHQGFCAWWMGMAAGSLVLALVVALPFAGITFIPLYQSLLVAFVLANASAVAGVFAHILVLTGTAERVRVPMWIALATYFLAFTTLLFALAPVGLTLGEGGIVVPQDGAPDSTLVLGATAAFYLPHLLAALSYGLVLGKLQERTARYRTALVGGSILLSSVLGVWIGYAAQMGREDLEIALLLVAFAAPAAVLLAYAPPLALRRRWGIGALSHDLV